MRTLSLLSLGLLAACDGGLGQYGLDTDLGLDDDSDTAIDGTDVEDDSDTDDVEVDTDEGITGNAGDCHLLDPLDLSGWSRTYSTNYSGTIGTEIQTSSGMQTAPGGASGYKIDSTITPTDGSPPIQIARYATCRSGAALWLADEVQGSGVASTPFGELPVELQTESYPLSDAQYLPVASAVGSGQFTFTYSKLTKDLTPADGLGAILAIFGGGGAVPNCKSDPALAENDATCTDVSVEMTAIGQQNVTVNGTTYSAYYFVEDIEQTPTASTTTPGGTGDIGAILEALGFGNAFGDLFGLGGGEPSTIIRAVWYVEGIGIVKEQQYDITNGGGQSDQNLIVTRELVSYSGL